MEKQIDELLGYQKSFDVIKRIMHHQQEKILIYFLCFSTDSLKIQNTIRSINNLEKSFKPLYQKLLDTLVVESITTTSRIEEFVSGILDNNLGIFLENEKKFILVDAKRNLSREIGEPDTEKVVRGSRDGFTENIATNLGLVRKRIKDKRLVMEKYEIGDISKTIISLVYLDGEVEPKIINEVKKDLTNIKVKELTMSDKALEELMIDNHYSPFPLVRYTERPDTFVAHLYQGMFGIIVDTSPSAILGPVSIFDHMQHPEEYRQNIISGSYLRFVRFFGIILTFLLVPVWFMLTYYYQNLPDFLKPFFVNDHYKLIFIQIIGIEISLELIRMASIYTPDALATSMGLIAGLFLGNLAIDVGLVTEVIVLIEVGSSIGSYITPSYELSLANKMIKMILVILVYFFKFYGLIFGLLGLVIYLICLKSFSRPYLYPLCPFNFKGMLKQIFRIPYRNK